MPFPRRLTGKIAACHSSTSVVTVLHVACSHPVPDLAVTVIFGTTMSPAPSTESPEEHLWVAGLRAGRVDVFRTVYETYMPDLWHFARKFVPADVAEDIVQDVMADLWRRRETVVIRETLVRYLFGAVHHRVLNHRRHARLVDAVERTPSSGAIPGLGEGPDAPDALSIGHDLESALRAALATLSPIQRGVLELRWLHEMSYDQIAEVLHISSEAARQHVSRAQRVIRPTLARFLERS